MSQDFENSPLPVLPAGAALHFVGVGGIGMSGLAGMLAGMGYRVTGSDRGAKQPENQRIIGALERAGIRIFAQDGSFAGDGLPDFLVYSSAIEEDNADFVAAPRVPRIHRAVTLAAAINAMTDCCSIAVSGSCGKTTVTGWLGETMYLAGLDPSCLNGGLMNRFRADACAGNYRHGRGGYMVFEADESDRSLVAYSPDYGLIMNIGTDHYSKEELAEVFGRFIGRLKKGLVVEREAWTRLKKYIPPHLKTVVFDGDGVEGDWRLTGYRAANGTIIAEVNGSQIIELPLSGRHNAVNAVAVMAVMDLLGVPAERTVPLLKEFKGVWRRFDFAGRTPAGARVYDDYAHNVEKIASCIASAQELTPDGRVFAVFQPHGFGPLGFMRGELLPALESVLRRDDCFIFLPPFYAGGTSSFKPTSQEVAAEYAAQGGRDYRVCGERRELGALLRAEAGPNDLILIMGARDNSLSDWAAELTRHGG
jgi:UDP-N-acetylmuramate--alanine ligase